jgi:hypothetical protein
MFEAMGVIPYSRDNNSVHYRLVIDSIAPLEPERKCFRMVGGVLVERTIKEVLPALETNHSGVSISMTIIIICHQLTIDA